jgi:hypothetical protein
LHELQIDFSILLPEFKNKRFRTEWFGREKIKVHREPMMEMEVKGRAPGQITVVREDHRFDEFG